MIHIIGNHSALVKRQLVDYGIFISYPVSEEEAFITEGSVEFGNRGAKQAQQI